MSPKKRSRRMLDNEKMAKKGLKDFLESVSNVAAASTIIKDGVNYVDNALFWEWLIKIHENGNYIPHLGSAEAARQFAQASSNQMEGIKTVIQGRGYEWDVFRQHHPHIFDINKLPGFNSPSATNLPGHDLQSYNPLTGSTVTVEAKSAMSDSGIEKSARKLFTYSTDRQFDVTQSVHDKAVEMGMTEDRFVRVRPDADVSQRANDRVHDATSGKIDVGISVEGVLEEVGKGALIGAVFYVGVSALTHYQSYKSGELSFEDFAEQLVKDGTKGGVMGGSMAAINVGVQYAATALGVGAPVTIPVMLIISIGLKKVIDPMFGDGEYAETLQSMKYYTSVQKGWHDFGRLSVALYEAQDSLRQVHAARSERAKLLNSFSSRLDNKLDEELSKE